MFIDILTKLFKLYKRITSFRLIVKLLDIRIREDLERSKTEINSTLKGSHTMFKWDLSLRCKNG